MAYEVGTVTRNYLGDYLAAVSETPTWYLMGLGVVQVDESPNPKLDKTAFVNTINVGADVTGYARVFPFDVQLRTGEGAAMLLVGIYRDSKIGSDAELLYVRGDLYVTPTGDLYPARKFTVAAEVTSVEAMGTEIVRIKGNFHQVGDQIEGTIDPTTGAIAFALPV